MVNASYLVTAKAITSVARAIYAIILAGMLGAELYGKFNYGLSWYILFIPVSVLGLNTILIHEIGRDRRQAPDLVGVTLALRTLSSFIAAGVSLLLALLVEPDPATRHLLLIFSIALFGRGLSIWANSIFKAYEISRYVFLQECLFRLLEVLVGLSLLFLGYDILALAWLHAAVWIVQCAVGIILVRRLIITPVMSWKFRAFARLIRRGSPFVVSSFLLGWQLQGAILMYRYFHGIDAELGQLALALQALFILGAVISEAGTGALPVLARSVERKDGKGSHYIDLVLRGGIFASAVLTITAVAIGPVVIRFLFGDTYPLTAMLLPWALALIAPYFWLNALTSMIVAHHRYVSMMLLNAIGAAVFTLAFLLVVPTLQAFGVILALSLGLVSVTLGQLILLQRYYAIPVASILFRSIAVVALSLLVTYITVPINAWLALIPGFATLYILSLLLRVVSIEELMSARDFLLSRIKLGIAK
jgi:O-antigen/teichoic acid export membrane protein